MKDLAVEMARQVRRRRLAAAKAKARPAPPPPGAAPPHPPAPADDAAPSGPRAAPLTEQLGIVGWGSLDPVLLAALAVEDPVLLVGAHGTGKSMLVERVAAALGLALRHYNASLIQYDDLVGIPLPDDAGTGLRFVGTEGAIWDAEFVFLDEISRCRPDVQNKLFPIVHERRVAGIPLRRLLHRWAAMNPPSSDSGEASAGGAPAYLGSEPLDPALADRFPFVVQVPSWKGLSRDDRSRLLTGAEAGAIGDGAGASGLASLVAETARLVPALDAALRPGIADYVVQLLTRLEAAALPQSPRRARMLVAGVIAVHAARVVLEGPDASPEASAHLAVGCGLPQTATDTPPRPAAVLAAHRQAWEIAKLERDSAWRRVLEEVDPVRRVLVADRLALCDDDLSRLITEAISAEPCDARRLGLATAMFLRFRSSRDLRPSAWEPLAQLSRRVLEPRNMATSVTAGGADFERWREISSFLAQQEDRGAPRNALERNFLLGGFPDIWARAGWRQALAGFRADLALFDVPPGEAP